MLALRRPQIPIFPEKYTFLPVSGPTRYIRRGAHAEHQHAVAERLASGVDQQQPAVAQRRGRVQHRTRT